MNFKKVRKLGVDTLSLRNLRLKLEVLDFFTFILKLKFKILYLLKIRKIF